MNAIIHRNYLHNDEHVIDSNAQEKKRYDGMHVRVENPHEEAEAEGGADGQADHEHAHQGEEDLPENLSFFITE